MANAFLLYNSNWRISSIKNIVSYLKLWQMYMKTPPWSLWHLGHRLSLINWQRKISKCYMHLLSISPIFFQFEANQKPFRNALPDPKKVVKAFIQSGNGNWDILLLLLLHKIVKKTSLYDPLGEFLSLTAEKKLGCINFLFLSLLCFWKFQWKMPKTDTLDALDDAMTTILTTNLDN